MQPSDAPEKDNNEKEDNSKGFVSKMALYDLTVARLTLTSISHKHAWTGADTASFDCMHYDGDAALETCANRLGLQPDQHVLDIGSGFCATGRFLASKYQVRVSGIELQPEVHELAVIINHKNADDRVVGNVRSVNADFLTLTADDLYEQGEQVPFDHALSLLCFMHLPESARRLLFEQIHHFLKEEGKIYIEDYYQRKLVTDKERDELREVVACTYLPTAAEYIDTMKEAGFGVFQFEDVTEQWRGILVARAEKYRATEDRSPELEKFYDTVAELFIAGNVGGVRLTATKLRK